MRFLELFEKKKNFFLTVLIIFFYALIVFSSAVFTFFDDLGFDFAGYAVRYNFAFNGWMMNHSSGLPASTFDPFLPSILPLLLKFLGFGSFTLPVTLSIFLLKMLIPLAFIPLGRLFKVNWKVSLALGLVFAVNPVLFKFFNRYYELFAWLFFILAFVSFYKFLNSKGFNRKQFLVTTFFVVLTVLSHPVPSFFLVFAFVFLMKSKQDLKKLLATGLFSISLAAFWLLPFFYFLDYANVVQHSGLLLSTFGISVSNYFFIIALFILSFLVFRRRKDFARETQFISLVLILAVVETFLSFIPIIDKPFAHSYHAFFLFSIVFVTMALLKKNALKEKSVVAVLNGFVVLLVCAIFFMPWIQGQYFFKEPSFSEYTLFNEKIDFSKVDALLQKIPKNVRFETLEFDPVISSYAAVKYNLLSGGGWGYNAFAPKMENNKVSKMLSMKLSCEKFEEFADSTAVNYWLALNSKGFQYLKNCGFEADSESAPALFKVSENISLVENGKLLKLENNYLKLRVEPPSTLIKMNYFPRWKGFSNGEEVELKKTETGIKIETEKQKEVELVYSLTLIDYLGIIISLIAVAFFLLLLISEVKSFSTSANH